MQNRGQYETVQQRKCSSFRKFLQLKESKLKKEMRIAATCLGCGEA